MRPRKRILLIDADEKRRSVRAYALWINGFHVIQASAPEPVEADLFIGVWPVPAFARVGTPSLLIFESKGVATELHSDRQLWKPSTAELVECAKVFAAGHRGPKKRTPSKLPVISDAPAREAACA